MYYGLDIGGTKIALGVYSGERALQWERRIATPHSDYPTFLQAIVNLVAEADSRFGCQGSVGIGIPGMPEIDEGRLYAANLPAATGHPLRADLSRLLGREVRIENDANCFALSEAWDDDLRSYPVVMGLILGTGVGGGIVVNGRPVTGHSFITGEFGHTCLPAVALDILGRDLPLTLCGCGKRGCTENYLSGRGFAWLWHHFYRQPLDAMQIVARYRAGDDRAHDHVARFTDLLAACLGDWLTALDPHVVVLGGGLSNFSELYAPLAARLPHYLLPLARVPRILPARYGDAGGMRGAAFLHLAE